MIAAWMFYCSLCALGLSLAAMLAERALLAGRAPVRPVWIGAMALSLFMPAVAFRIAQRPVRPDSAIDAGVAGATDPVREAAPPVSPLAAMAPSSSPARDWRATLARFDEPLALTWIALSLALAFNFFGGVVTLVWMRRQWQRRVVQGVPLFVAERTGPAVVGVVSPQIVLPEWVLALEPSQLTLVLRHEQEHQHASDGRLLTAAQLALILMPWNLALWWQLLRLRAAVELDCDARVLRDADVRSYGDLLLEVARPRRGPRLMGVTAFAERAVQLERRIRLLKRHRARTSRAARAAAAGIALFAVTAAMAAPHPPAPVRAAAAPSRRETQVSAASSPAPAVAPTTDLGNTQVAAAGHDAAAAPPHASQTAAARRDSRRGARATPPALTTRAPCSATSAQVPFVVDTIMTGCSMASS